MNTSRQVRIPVVTIGALQTLNGSKKSLGSTSYVQLKRRKIDSCRLAISPALEDVRIVESSELEDEFRTSSSTELSTILIWIEYPG